MPATDGSFADLIVRPKEHGQRSMNDLNKFTGVANAGKQNDENG
jgi:hypothetical protein